MRIVLFGAGAGLGLAFWRNLPPDPAPRVFVAVVVAAGLLVVALFCGRAWGRGAYASATAVAVASADASAVAGGGDARAQVVVNVGDARRVVDVVESGTLVQARMTELRGATAHQIEGDQGAEAKPAPTRPNPANDAQPATLAYTIPPPSRRFVDGVDYGPR